MLLLISCVSNEPSKSFEENVECFVEVEDEAISTNDMSAYLDADCDGIPALNDCDDTDSESTHIAIDADCDGVSFWRDCNDLDAESTYTSIDADCDGVLTGDDFDSSTVNYMDCDGVCRIR